MSADSKLKVEIRDHRLVTLPELYEEYEKSHREQSQLLFEEKIRILVNLQEIASSWGNRKDINVWKIG